MRKLLLVVLALALPGCAAGFRAGGGNGVDAGVAVGPPVLVQYPGNYAMPGFYQPQVPPAGYAALGNDTPAPRMALPETARY